VHLTMQLFLFDHCQFNSLEACINLINLLLFFEIICSYFFTSTLFWFSKKQTGKLGKPFDCKYRILPDFPEFWFSDFFQDFLYSILIWWRFWFPLHFFVVWFLSLESRRIDNRSIDSISILCVQHRFGAGTSRRKCCQGFGRPRCQWSCHLFI
jgi:hypothetical protein